MTKLGSTGLGADCHFMAVAVDAIFRSLVQMIEIFFFSAARCPIFRIINSLVIPSFHPSILLPGLRSAGWSCYPHPRHDLFGLRIPIRIPRWVKDEYPRNPDSAPWKARFTGGNQPSLHNLEDGGYNEL